MADQQMTSKEDGTVGVESDELSGDFELLDDTKSASEGGASSESGEQKPDDGVDEEVASGDESGSDDGESQSESEQSGESQEGSRGDESPRFSKALQKLQQDQAAQKAQNDRIEKMLAEILAGRSQQQVKQEPAKQEPSPDDEIDSFLADLEKGGDDDVLTPKQLAARLRSYETMNRRRAELIRGEAKSEIGRTRESAEATRHEQSWRAANPEIAGQYNTIIQKTHEHVRAAMPNIDPSSPQYAAAWHVAHDFITKSAKSQVTSKIPAKGASVSKAVPPTTKPSTGPRKPVPSSVKPVPSKSASAKSESNEVEENPWDIPNPMKWMNA